MSPSLRPRGPAAAAALVAVLSIAPRVEAATAPAAQKPHRPQGRIHVTRHSADGGRDRGLGLALGVADCDDANRDLGAFHINFDQVAHGPGPGQAQEPRVVVWLQRDDLACSRREGEQAAGPDRPVLAAARVAPGRLGGGIMLPSAELTAAGEDASATRLRAATLLAAGGQDACAEAHMEMARPWRLCVALAADDGSTLDAGHAAIGEYRFWVATRPPPAPRLEDVVGRHLRVDGAVRAADAGGAAGSIELLWAPAAAVDAAKLDHACAAWAADPQVRPSTYARDLALPASRRASEVAPFTLHLEPDASFLLCARQQDVAGNHSDWSEVERMRAHIAAGLFTSGADGLTVGHCGQGAVGAAPLGLGWALVRGLRRRRQRRPPGG